MTAMMRVIEKTRKSRKERTSGCCACVCGRAPTSWFCTQLRGGPYTGKGTPPSRSRARSSIRDTQATEDICVIRKSLLIPSPLSYEYGSIALGVQASSQITQFENSVKTWARHKTTTTSICYLFLPTATDDRWIIALDPAGRRSRQVSTFDN
jgi:hypothetical protein